MPTSTIQAQIAFKNLLGKSQTNNTLGVLNENIGYFLNVPSQNVWSSTIPDNNPIGAVSNSVAVKVKAVLTFIPASLNSGNYAAYQAKWDSTPPAGIDPKTNLAFAFGSGSLKDIKAGDNIYDFISSSNGFKYEVAPFVNTTEISQGDERDWVFQYSSGVFYQSNVAYGAAYSPPTHIEGYFYIGNKLSALDPVGPDVVRVSATGPVSNDYYATTSTPLISTYSISNLFLVDFAYGNTTSVKLNINYLGTHSVYKFGPGGLGELTSGDIIGASGSNAGPIYYLNWDSDGYFVFNTSSPQQFPGAYSNPNLTLNPLGGVYEGYSFNTVQFQDMFTDLLYPEQLGNITSFNITGTTQGNISLIDLGRPITGVLTFSWGLSNPTGLTGPLVVADVTDGPNDPNWPIKSTLFSTYSISNSPVGYTYPSSVFSNTVRTRDYLLYIPRLNGTTIAKYNHITWTHRAYYGSSTYTTLTPTQVTGLSSSLVTQSLGSYTITGTQGYKYMAFPNVTGYSFKNATTFGLPLVLSGSLDGYSLSDNDINYTTLSVTNSYGISSTYRIYRTKNQITGTLSVNITN